MNHIKNYKFTKWLITFMLCLMLNLCFVLPSLATGPPGGSDAMVNGIEVTAISADLVGTPTDFNQIAGGIVNYSFGIIALVFVLVIMIGGYFLMSASGKEENVAKAKAFIINGVSGLIVIMVIYALVYVVMFSLNNAINGAG